MQAARKDLARGDPRIVIVEQGSQYTLKIGQVYRDLGYRSVVVESKRASKWIKKHKPRLVVLSGSRSSVFDAEAPKLPEGLLELVENGTVRVLYGICYGQQELAHELGGTVSVANDNAEYGPAKIVVCDTAHYLFRDLPQEQDVWMSHGNSVTVAPENFTVLARTETGAIAAMSKGSIVATQWHGEVTQTVHGKEQLHRIALAAGCEPDWEALSQIHVMQDGFRDLPETARVIMGFSGGVDSTTMAAGAVPIFGERLLGLTIDGGQLGENELEEIELNAKTVGIQHRIVDAKAEFLEAMSVYMYTDKKSPWWKRAVSPIVNYVAKKVFGYAGTIDAEEKRRRFKSVYVRIFMREASRFGAIYILQGTLAPDRIESGATGAAVIKSHHNVGNDFGSLIQLHPFDHLFKYEVRALARELKLPERICARHPSPGPGNYIRVVGVPVSQDLLNTVSWAQARVKEILIKHNYYGEDCISQLVVSYNGTKMVGVKGDERVYKGSIMVRAVLTTDFMTAEGVYFPEVIAQEIKKVLRQHSGFVRVLFDATDKGPGSTEPE